MTDHLHIFISIDILDPQPQNPTLIQRDGQIAGIARQISNSGFYPSHATIVRATNGRYQVISGHDRMEAARLAGITSVDLEILAQPTHITGKTT